MLCRGQVANCQCRKQTVPRGRRTILLAAQAETFDDQLLGRSPDEMRETVMQQARSYWAQPSRHPTSKEDGTKMGNSIKSDIRVLLPCNDKRGKQE